jgi:hypothetical protein
MSLFKSLYKKPLRESVDPNDLPENKPLPYRDMYRAARDVKDDADLNGGKTKYGGIDWSDYGAKGVKHVSPENNPYFDDRNSLYINTKQPGTGKQFIQGHYFDNQNGQYLNNGTDPSIFNFKEELFNTLDQSPINPGTRPDMPGYNGLTMPAVTVAAPKQPQAQARPASTPQKRKIDFDTTMNDKWSTGRRLGDNGTVGRALAQKRRAGK